MVLPGLLSNLFQNVDYTRHLVYEPQQVVCLLGLKHSPGLPAGYDLGSNVQQGFETLL